MQKIAERVLKFCRVVLKEFYKESSRVLSGLRQGPQVIQRYVVACQNLLYFRLYTLGSSLYSAYSTPAPPPPEKIKYLIG